MMPFDLKSFLDRCVRLKIALLLGSLAFAGCTSPGIRTSGLNDDSVAAPETNTRLIGDMAQSFGLQWTRLESVALVSQLASTGSDPPPGTYRTLLIREMQTHEIKNPSQVLAAPSNSLVLLCGYLPPGVQKGDRYDVQVSLPPGSETKSLRNGWLMQSRMRDLAVIENQLRNGHVLGLAQGHVLVEGVVHEGNDPRLANRGVAIAAGVAQHARPIGLLLAAEHKSVQASAAMGNAINARFHMFDRGQKQGVATPKNDSYVEITVLPRYKYNLTRYLRVIRALAIKETPAQRGVRLVSLEQQLLQPFTSSQAALRLEAIGKEAEPVLRKGLASDDPEIRFYSAEALAYLDVPEAAPELKQVALREPAFRWHALTALGAMDQIAAYEALSDLLHVSSVETRSGALHALATSNPREPLLNGTVLDNQFALYAIPSRGEPLVHVSTSRRAEIAIFGADMELTPATPLFAGPNVVIKPQGANQLRLSRFSANAEDKHEETSRKLADVVKAVIALGGTYSDVISLVLEAKKSGALEARVAMDALPQAGRVFERGEGDEVTPDPNSNANTVVHAGHTAPLGEPGDATPPKSIKDARPGTPLPTLFAPPKGANEPAEPHSSSNPKDHPGDSEKTEPNSVGRPTGFFGRMGSWFRSS